MIYLIVRTMAAIYDRNLENIAQSTTIPSGDLR